MVSNNNRKWVVVVAILALSFGLIFGTAYNEPNERKTLRVVVAANFFTTLKILVEFFEKQCDCQVELITGSSVKLSIQINQGLPIDLFLSADKKSIDYLLDKGKVHARSVMPYAQGSIVLWSPVYNNVIEAFKQGGLPTLCIANPKFSPYGIVSLAALTNLLSEVELHPTLIYANNVNQVITIVESGAQAGIISLSQWLHWQQNNPNIGSYWPIPSSYHPPVVQYMAIPKHSGKQQLAEQMSQFLMSSFTQNYIKTMGYQSVNGLQINGSQQ